MVLLEYLLTSYLIYLLYNHVPHQKFALRRISLRYCLCEGSWIILRFPAEVIFGRLAPLIFCSGYVVVIVTIILYVLGTVVRKVINTNPQL